MHPKVKATNLSYKINEKKLFQNISFELMAGKAIHIQGDNGSGKTTLLKIICGLTNQVKGEIEKKLDKQLCFLGHKNALKHMGTPQQIWGRVFCRKKSPCGRTPGPQRACKTHKTH